MRATSVGIHRLDKITQYMYFQIISGKGDIPMVQEKKIPESHPDIHFLSLSFGLLPAVERREPLVSCRSHKLHAIVTYGNSQTPDL